MAIAFRDIQHAPLPVKAKKERQPRQPKYPMNGIPVGGARAFPIGEGDPKKVKTNVYQTAVRYRKANPGWDFKVSVVDGEVLVHRIAGGKDVIAPAASDEGNGGSPAAVAGEGWGGLGEPAADVNSETVSNGTYDYSQAAAE